jgi:hypothetical protein
MYKGNFLMHLPKLKDLDDKLEHTSIKIEFKYDTLNNYNC